MDVPVINKGLKLCIILSVKAMVFLLKMAWQGTLIKGFI